MLKRFGLNQNLAVICGTIVINIFFRFMWDSLLPLYLRRLGANEWQVGVSFTLLLIARNFFSVVGGALADRYGRKLLIAAPMFGIVPFYFVAAWADNWVLAVAMLVGTNAMGALQWPALSALIAESAEEDRVARAYSLSELAVIIGMIAGPLAGAALLAVIDIPAMMLANALAVFCTGAWRAIGLQETARRTRSVASASLRQAFDANVWWMILTATMIAASFSVPFGPYFAILARDVWRNSDAEINLLFAMGNVASLIGIALGRLADRWGGRRLLILCALGYGLAVIVWGFAPSWQWGIVPLLCVFAFAEAIFIAQQTLQVEVTERETRSSVFGVLTTTSGFIGGFGPTIGAWLVVLGGNALPFVGAGVMGFLAILAVVPVRKKQ